MAGEHSETLYEHAGGDAGLRNLVEVAIEFGTEIARVNSNAASDDELHPLRDIPRWRW